MFRSTNRSSTTTDDATSLSSLFSLRLFFIVALLIGSSYIDIDSFSTNAISSSSSTNNGGIHNNKNNNNKKMPNLPFGDINVVVLTDLHSWVSTIIY